MRRAFRYLLNGLTTLSLLLCAAACVLWVRSYWVADRYSWDNGPGDRSWAESRRGLTDLWRFRLDWPETQWDGPPGYAAAPSPRANDQDWAAAHAVFYLYRDADYNGAKVTGLVTPHWIWVVATGGLPALRCTVSVCRRRAARRRGRCRTCLYDLRATPGRCPECGTIPAPT